MASASEPKKFVGSVDACFGVFWTHKSASVYFKPLDFEGMKYLEDRLAWGSRRALLAPPSKYVMNYFVTRARSTKYVESEARVMSLVLIEGIAELKRL